MKKVSGLTVISLLTLTLLSSCAQPKEKEGALDTPKKELVQKVTINVTQELNSIDPANTVDANSNIALNNIYEGLYRLGDDNQPVPAGAEALPEISEDGLDYTIKLREAKWSNGDPVLAEDYVFAWKRAVAAENAAENTYLYTSIRHADEIIKGEMDKDSLGVTAEGNDVLKIKLMKATPHFTTLPAIPAFYPLKESYVAEARAKFASDSEHALYNGPFIMTDFEGPGIGSHWTYEKNPAYWDQEKVKMAEINVEVVKETATNVGLFENGEVDDVSISGEYAKSKLNDPAFVAEKPAQTIFIGYNQTKKIYQNKKIRQAISLIIDRQSIAENILGNGVRPATGLIFNGLYHNPETQEEFSKASGNHLKTDVEAAQKLWLEGKKEVGLKEDDEVPIQLITFENEDMKKVAEYLQGVFADNLKGAQLEPAVYPVSVFMKNASNQDFDLYLVSWGADFPDPSSLFQLFQSDVSYNWGKYQSQAYDGLLKAAAGEHALVPVKRWQDLLDAEQTLMDDQGITPLYFSAPTYLRNPNLKDLCFHNVGPRFEYKTMYLAE